MSKMVEFRTRIGKVTRKGGATVNVIDCPASQPDDDLVRMLGEMQDRARDGRIIGCGVAGVSRDGSVSTAYVVGRNVFTLMGAVRGLGRRIEVEVDTR